MLSTQRKHASKEGAIVAALDIGASKVACFVARLEPGYDGAIDAEVIGVGHCGGGVHIKANHPRLDATETAVRTVVDAAERMAGEHIRDVSVAVSGRHLQCRRVCVDLELHGGCATEEDICDSLDEGAKAAAEEGNEELHSLPISFSVDGDETIADPRGYYGRQLTTQMLAVSARESALANLSAAIERCGLHISEFVASSYAASEAVLIEDEKELGVVLIDIGARSTAYAAYNDGALIDCGGIPVGGANVTSDIAQVFGAPLAHAERIKSLYGSALSGVGDEHRFVEFPILGATNEIARISRADLSAVIAPRLEEILEMILARLPEHGAPHSALRRVVLTGGGSLLVGVRETAERVLSMKARLGRPIAIAGAPEAVMAPAFSVCAGVIHQAAKRFSGEDSTILSLRSKRRAGGLLGNVGIWFRDKF